MLGDVVMLLEYIAEMIGVYFTHVFGAKVVYNYEKENRMLLVSPNVWFGGKLVVTLLYK